MFKMSETDWVTLILCSVELYYEKYYDYELVRLASVGILRKEREPGVGKLGWHGN